MTQDEKLEFLKKIAASKDNDKKLQLIKKKVDPNMKLYRYRPFGNDEKKRQKEVLSLKNLTPWSSRYDKLDDQLEGINSNSGLNDLHNAQGYLNRKNNSINELNQSLESAKSKKDRIRCFDKFNRSKNTLNNMEVKISSQKSIEAGERELRKNFSMVCFTENSPFADNNLWKEYTETGGFCIEYSLFDILDAGYIIAPIYYIDDRSFSTIKQIFDDESYVFLTKTKNGTNKFTKKNADWEHQNEWRIVSKNKKCKMGKYLKKEIIPQSIIGMDIPNKEDIKETVSELNRIKGLNIMYHVL